MLQTKKQKQKRNTD